jgi:hypothetical protein
MSTDISRLSIAVIAWFSVSMEKPLEQMKRVSWGFMQLLTLVTLLIMSCVM